MHPFEPMVNFLVLLSALSVAAERLANVLKLRSPDLRHPPNDGSAMGGKERERAIAHRALAVSVLLAVIVKADFFEIVARLDAPWSTLGWSRGAVASPGRLLATLAGTVLTGISLGFGSKFWHDVLDVIASAREALRK